MDIAPKYSFNFFVVFDQMSEEIGISNSIKGVYNEDYVRYVDRKKATQNSSLPPNVEPGQRDYPIKKPLPELTGGGGDGSGGGGGDGW